MTTKPDAEGAVRLYMLFLVDPESLRDEAGISKAETAVAEAKDPIDRLKALAALDRARSVDGEQYRQDFITHAKAFADAEGIPAKIFLEAGVPAADLNDAGLAVGNSIRGARTQRSSRGRAPSLTLDEVAGALPSAEFKLTDLAAAIGREPGTTRNYLNKLVSSGVVAEVGDDPNHDGRGKASKLYVKA